jgi:hypothetical protein
MQALHRQGHPRFAQDLVLDPEETEVQGGRPILVEDENHKSIGRVSDEVAAERRPTEIPPVTFLPHDQKPGREESGTAGTPQGLLGTFTPATGEALSKE